MAIVKHNVRTFRPTNPHHCKVCGEQFYYWGHDTESMGQGKNFCEKHNSWSWVPLNRDDTPHICHGAGSPPQHDGDSGANDASENHANGEPINSALSAGLITSDEARAETLAASAEMDAMQALKVLMSALGTGPDVDRDTIKQVVAEELATLLTKIGMVPTMVHVTKPDGSVKEIKGAAHFMLPAVIKRLARGKHVFMVGPAGTGKSYIADQAAEALDLASYAISLTPQTSKTDILGYMTADGTYVRTLYREAFEHGGVFHFDEIDQSNPAILGVINASLAGKRAAFPDGMVERHPEFRCIASGNTYGTGPDRQFVGRQAMDAATKDRFSIIEIPYDLKLEEHLCMGTGLAADEVRKVLAYIRYLRGKAQEFKLPLAFGPRRAEGMCDALADGFPIDQAISMEVRRGISDADWSKITAGAPAVA